MAHISESAFLRRNLEEAANFVRALTPGEIDHAKYDGIIPEDTVVKSEQPLNEGRFSVLKPLADQNERAHLYARPFDHATREDLNQIVYVETSEGRKPVRIRDRKIVKNH